MFIMQNDLFMNLKYNQILSLTQDFQFTNFFWCSRQNYWVWAWFWW